MELSALRFDDDSGQRSPISTEDQVSSAQFGTVHIGVAWMQVTILCGLLHLAPPTL